MQTYAPCHFAYHGLVALRARNRKVAGSWLTQAGLGGLSHSWLIGCKPDVHRSTASSLEQVANLQCAVANSAFHPSGVSK